MKTAVPANRGGVATRAAWTALAGSIVAFTVSIIGPSNFPELAVGVVAVNIGCAAGAVLCWYPRTSYNTEVLAWRCISLALLGSLLANVFYTWEAATTAVVPHPSWSDALYLSSYPLFYIAMVVMLRVRVVRFHISMWLDGLVVGLGAGAVAVAFVIGPLLDPGTGGAAQVVTNLAYPVADLVLLVLLFAMCGVLGLRPEPALMWLAAGMALNLAADIGFLLLDLAGAYAEGDPINLLWLLGVLAFAVAARSRPRTFDRQTLLEGTTTRVGWRLVAVPAGANVAAVGILVLGIGHELPWLAGVLAGACALLAIARTGLTLRELRDLPAARREARTDALTGLANRRQLADRYSQIHAARPDEPIALLLVDLDGFKAINDSLGHEAGDTLLRSVAQRLASSMRSSDVLARLGGDEFAALLSPPTTMAQAAAVAERMRTSLSTPVSVEGISLTAQGSIGITVGSATEATLAQLLRSADLAMYRAKSTNSGIASVSPRGDADTDRHRLTADDARAALAAAQFTIHLQPKIELTTGRIVGLEALARWAHPLRGLLPPAEFLPLINRGGLQSHLTTTVLDLALDAASRWWSVAEVPVSINIPPILLADRELLARLAAAITRHALPFRALTIEITEDAIMSDAVRTHELMRRIRGSGIGIAIDDYGTGYSSLAYLHRFPATELKLDQAFIADVVDAPRSRAIVRHTVALSRDLGMTLVAEGVETAQSVAVLLELGCEIGQGFHLGRPTTISRSVERLTVRPNGPAGRGSG